MKSGIYCITCVKTEQRYVGTALDWEKRIAQHVSKLRKGTHKNIRLQTAWSVYGPTEFEIKLLEECKIPDLLERERYWVDKFKSDQDGFNYAQKLGSNGNLTHGMTHSRAHKSWESMKQRCTNPTSSDYPRYGAKGVKICDAWLDFENFYHDMGDRPEGTSLDRFPNNKGNYEPGNCRWATPPQQQRNIGVNQYLTVQGETKLLVDWARQMNIPVDLLRKRHKAGIRGLRLFAASYSRYKGVRDADGEVVQRINKPTHALKYTHNGKTLSITEWAVELDIDRSTLAQRIQRRGMSLERALSTAELKKGKTGPRKGHVMIEAFGKTQSLTSWAREYNLPVSTLKNRLYRAKLSPEQALTA